LALADLRKLNFLSIDGMVNTSTYDFYNIDDRRL
jgi:hypothetical protein